MRRPEQITLAILTAVLSLPACKGSADPVRKDTADVRIALDWSGFPQEVPTGVSVYCYPVDAPERGPFIYRTNDISCVSASLPVGRYDLLAFNQSDTEFGSLHFEGLDRYSTATAVLEDLTVKWAVPSGGQTVKYEPEWLAVDTFEGLEITEEDLLADAPEHETVTLSPRNVVYSGEVSVRAEGADRIRSIRGCVTGLSGTYRLSGGEQSSVPPVAHVLESWDKARGKGDGDSGELTVTFRSFGFPDTDQQGAGATNLNLSFLLSDRKTVCDFSFPVGDRFVTDGDSRRLELSIESGEIELPEPEEESGGGQGDSGGGGFGATMNEWDRDQVVDVPVTDRKQSSIINHHKPL